MLMLTVRSFIVSVNFNAKHIKDIDTYTECNEGFVTVVYFGLCLNSLTEKYEYSKLSTVVWLE